MSYVNINIEDLPDGQMDFQVVYLDGFDKESHAHQHALLLTKYMERISTRQSEPELITSTGAEVVYTGSKILATTGAAGDGDGLGAPEEGAHVAADPS